MVEYLTTAVFYEHPMVSLIEPWSLDQPAGCSVIIFSSV
jgi:hypothetical protein